MYTSTSAQGEAAKLRYGCYNHGASAMFPPRSDKLLLSICLYGWPVALCSLAILAELWSAMLERRRRRNSRQQGFDVLFK